MGMQLAGTEIEARTTELVETFKDLEGPLLPILHGIQEEFGYVPSESLPVIASALNLTRAEVHGVVTFYHDYRRHPAGRHVLKLCRAEACQSVGAEALYADARRRFAAREDVEVDEVFCLGNCALGPSGMVDGRLHGRLSSERLLAITEEWAR